jgi:hypothetical protein
MVCNDGVPALVGWQPCFGTLHSTSARGAQNCNPPKHVPSNQFPCHRLNLGYAADRNTTSSLRLQPTQTPPSIANRSTKLVRAETGTRRLLPMQTLGSAPRATSSYVLVRPNPSHAAASSTRRRPRAGSNAPTTGGPLGRAKLCCLGSSPYPYE